LILLVDGAEGLEVGFVGRKLVDALEVMVPANDLIRHAKGRQELGCQLMAFGRTGK